MLDVSRAARRPRPALPVLDQANADGPGSSTKAHWIEQIQIRMNSWRSQAAVYMGLALDDAQGID